jgi:CDGSH-type Zn-finger protein/protein-tyrosine-phosphatase
MVNSILNIIADSDQLNEDRIQLLDQLSELVLNAHNKNGFCNLTFICTHNSRRSQLAELWLSYFLDHYCFKEIYTYSGGTETTALNVRIVNALKRFGFTFHKIGSEENPRYIIDGLHKIFFSKVYNDHLNPSKDFIAVMVCDHADDNCPIVHGAESRFSLKYIDPKHSDDTDKEDETYDNKVLEIAKEMCYLARKIIAAQLPLRAGNSPTRVELIAGKKYAWCTCGLSKTQPFCDGKHRGTDSRPLKFVAEESKTVSICNCKASKNSYFCDGSHKDLSS